MRRIETGSTVLEADKAIAAHQRSGLRRPSRLVGKLMGT